MFNGGWNFGSLCMVGLAYLIRSWNYLQITFASIALLLLGSKLINDTTLVIGNWRPDNCQTDEDIRPLISRQKYWAKFLWKQNYSHLWTLTWKVIWYLTPESPRWLLETNQYEESEKNLRSIAKINGRELKNSEFTQKFEELKRRYSDTQKGIR